jgi:hypothetical protein
MVRRTRRGVANPALPKIAMIAVGAAVMPGSYHPHGGPARIRRESAQQELRRVPHSPEDAGKSSAHFAQLLLAQAAVVPISNSQKNVEAENPAQQLLFGR